MAGIASLVLSHRGSASQRISAARTRIARVFASHRIAVSVFSTHRRSHRIAARIARYGSLNIGISRALRAPEMLTKSRKCLPGPPAQDPGKVYKSPGTVHKTLQTLSGDSPKTSQTVPRLFQDFCTVPWPEAPRDIFELVRDRLVPNS